MPHSSPHFRPSSDDRPSAAPAPPLSLKETLGGKSFVVVGGTGFLGKVWLSLVLSHLPELEHVYLVVRPKEGHGVAERFEKKILTTEVFLPLREKHGAGFDEFVKSKVTPISGDISQPLCGLDSLLRDRVRGRIAAVVNVAGIVDFDPPLDEALEVNAFGCQNLVALARDLGDVPVLHTSTCFTAGGRTGPIEELDPREIPFPRAFELDKSDWDPEREIAECLDVIEQARHRASDAFRQSRFVDEAKQNLRARDEPTSGGALDDELARVRRKFVESQLSGLGMERAKYWGWPNTYTYTKSIGEQVIAGSGLPFCIVRPAIVESTLAFPFPGWNEGINTSSPFIFLIRQGGLQVPGSSNNLDLIPCDLVCSAITLALGELVEGRQKPVYQAAASDLNPCTMARFFELSGLHKRRLYQRTGKGGPVVSAIQQRFESAFLSKEEYEAYGPKKLADGAEALGGLFRTVGKGPLASILKPAAKGLDGFAYQQRRLARVMDTFLPFVAEYQYVFRADCVRAAFSRLSDEEKELFSFRPEDIDWREWFLEIHAPALERHVFPEMERRLARKERPPRAHASLTSLLRDMASRHDRKVALQLLEKDGFARLSYRDLETLALGTAARLRQRGVTPGARVVLSGKNHPAWPVAFFGILLAGGTVVPLDSGAERTAAKNVYDASKAAAFIGDGAAHARFGETLGLTTSNSLSFEECLVAPAESDEAERGYDAKPEELACLLYTSGTTGSPKGVMLSHGNLTALVAALAPLFPLTSGDRLLSVLPLHHTFELTCGLLLPLSRGARVAYLDELSGERLGQGLRELRATALIGVPALWELLERRIEARVREKGPFAERAFDMALEVSRLIGKKTGLDVGRALFGSVHSELGGHLKYLVSGGAALREDTHALFQGLGLHLAEGYGLTEAAPVLTVARGGPSAKAGHVGRAVPGVEVRIDKPNERGVGEVLARGPNVMLGYEGDPEATARVLDADGWLRTGDLGKLDGRGRLEIVGRQKDVVVASNGENLYPDDLEARLGPVPVVEEYAFLGVADGRGGERLALVFVPEKDASGSRALERNAARESMERALAVLSNRERPAVIVAWDETLPRTATRKVKRAELRALVEARLVDESGGADDGRVVLDSIVVAWVARIARRSPADIRATSTLRGDLGFDSLMAFELLVALEKELGRTLDAEELSRSATVGDLDRAIEKTVGLRVRSRTREVEDVETEIPVLPEVVRDATKEAIERGQLGFYEKVMRTRVSGRVHVPHNRRTLVVSNHASHLDMGLVKYALGSYGEGLVTLAAQDYFFEGHPLKRAFVEQLTNLVPMTRSGSLRSALRKAGEILDRGHTLLLFPEGTRSADGSLGEFKAAAGHLALHHRVDVLPIWLGGTFRALPRGASFPRSRDIEARIGPLLSYAELREATAGLSSIDAARVVSQVTRLAVRALADGKVFTLADVDVAAIRKSTVPEEQGLSGVFEELKERFVQGAVEAPLSYYFSVGDERWTVRATRAELEVARGKTVEAADCVLKTTPDLFEKIVRKAYVPGPAEFMTGQIKTNNVAHLLTMQKLFRLALPTDEFRRTHAGIEEKA